MGNKGPWLFFVAGVAWLAIPAVALAQGIVPCMGIDDCNLCQVGQLMKNIINFLLASSIFVAVIMFAYAGFLYGTSSGNEAKVTKAHKVFRNVFIGFLVAIAAWLVVQTIISVVFDGTAFVGGNWRELQCVSEVTDDPKGGGRLIGTSLSDVINQVFPRVTGGGTGIVTTPGGGTNSEGTYSHAEAEGQLAGITVSSTGGCSDPSGPTCTSLEGIRKDTVDQIVNLKNACGCAITITGGTETGHAAGDTSHSSGYKIDLDYGNSTALNNYIKTNFTPAGVRSGGHGGPIYKDPYGNEYVFEQNYNHWDVTIKKVGPYGN